MPMKIRSDIYVGARFPTNKCGTIEIVNIKDSYNITVRFLETGYETKVKTGNIRLGKVYDKIKPMVCGVGFIGDGPHKTDDNKTYDTWASMLNRCYTPKSDNHKINWHDVSVRTDWHCFQNFAEWFEDKIKIFHNSNIRYALDKDLMFPGNRIYSSDNCCVIPERINTIMTSSLRLNRELPLGVKQKHYRYFTELKSIDGTRINIGPFHSIREAQIEYWHAKSEVIKLATMQYWPYLPESLAMRLINFNHSNALDYYGQEAVLWD